MYKMVILRFTKMVAKDGITQTDVKSLFWSYNGHLKFYKDVIQDGYQIFCTSVRFTKKGEQNGCQGWYNLNRR